MFLQCRLTVCCGVIYRGAYGECLLDSACYRPCPAHSTRIEDVGGEGNKKVLTNESKPPSVDSGNDESSSLDELTDADSCGADVAASTVDMAIDLSVRGPLLDVIPRPALPSTIRLLAINEVWWHVIVRNFCILYCNTDRLLFWNNFYVFVEFIAGKVLFLACNSSFYGKRACILVDTLIMESFSRSVYRMTAIVCRMLIWRSL